MVIDSTSQPLNKKRTASGHCKGRDGALQSHSLLLLARGGDRDGDMKKHCAPSGMG